MATGAFSQNVGKLFSELKLVTDNLLFVYMYVAANWEGTEKDHVHVGGGYLSEGDEQSSDGRHHNDTNQKEGDMLTPELDLQREKKTGEVIGVVFSHVSIGRNPIYWHSNSLS